MLPFSLLVCLFPLSLPSGVKKTVGLATNNDSVGSAQLRKWRDRGSALCELTPGRQGPRWSPGSLRGRKTVPPTAKLIKGNLCFCPQVKFLFSCRY